MSKDVSVYTRLEFNNKSTNKSDFFEEISHFLSDSISNSVSPSVIEDALRQREALGTTGFGDGLAIPHGKVIGLEGAHLFYVRLDQEVEWDSLDEKPAKYIFIILVSDNDVSNNHLKILSKLSYNLMDPEYQKQIKEEKDTGNLRAIIEKMFTE